MIEALVNGHWKSFNSDKLQPGTTSFHFGPGLYETFRTKNYRPVLLGPHLDRLFNSAKKVNLRIIYSRKEITEMVLFVVNKFHEKDQRARIIVATDKVIIYTTPLNLNKKIYKGVSTITLCGQRDSPNIKTTDYQICLDAYETAKSKNCFEAILLDTGGKVLEGSRSNVFWVINNSLFTREGNVLPGVTRQTIINKSPYPINYSKINKYDFKQINELFLTNSGSGIIPVLKIDSTNIGNGSPGPITTELLKLYEEWCND